MFKRILILSASVGNGHVTAAESLKKAFEIKGLAAEVRHEDVLKFTNPLFRRLYSKAYIGLVNSMPEVLGYMYDQLDEPWKNEEDKVKYIPLQAREGDLAIFLISGATEILHEKERYYIVPQGAVLMLEREEDF